MPELPEVETVRRGLLPAMKGQVVSRVELRRPDLRWPLPAQMSKRLTGACLTDLRRRSKYLLLDLDRGETLIWHLGMSGRVIVDTLSKGAGQLGKFMHANTAPGKHDHVVFELSNGTRVTFNDPRRFGAMDLTDTNRLHEHRLLSALGPEPLGNAFNAERLYVAFRGRKASVKSSLLDQRNVAGLGNIYVCEALHRAGISPTRPAGRVSRAEVEHLSVAIRDVLREAIDAGGSSLRDYRRTDGELGYFQHRFAVYGREGEHCTSDGCSGLVVRIVQSGRSSFYCKRCQR